MCTRVYASNKKHMISMQKGKESQPHRSQQKGKESWIPWAVDM